MFVVFPGGSEVKESACNAGDLGSIPGSGRSPGGGNGNPLQYSCLENLMDIGAWWATVHRVTKSPTRLSNFTHTHTLFQIIFLFRLLQNIEQSSLCYTEGPCWLSILNIEVLACESQTPRLSLPLLDNCHNLYGIFFVLFNQNPSPFIFSQHQLVLSIVLSFGIKWI